MSSTSKKNMVLEMYRDKRTVFKLCDLAMLVRDGDSKSLIQRINYYISKGYFHRPRKGIYVKPGYTPEEIACRLYTPSYISMEYVLQRAGVMFQYSEAITCISYLSRSIEIEGTRIVYKRIKGEIILSPGGLTRKNNLNIATPERAFLDMLYLYKSYYFDNLRPLDKESILKILPIYKCKTLTDKVIKMIDDGEFRET